MSDRAVVTCRHHRLLTPIKLAGIDCILMTDVIND
jgi:hypothetical protein